MIHSRSKYKIFLLETKPAFSKTSFCSFSSCSMVWVLRAMRATRLGECYWLWLLRWRLSRGWGWWWAVIILWVLGKRCWPEWHGCLLRILWGRGWWWWWVRVLFIVIVVFWNRTEWSIHSLDTRSSSFACRDLPSWRTILRSGCQSCSCFRYAPQMGLLTSRFIYFTKPSKSIPSPFNSTINDNKLYGNQISNCSSLSFNSKIWGCRWEPSLKVMALATIGLLIPQARPSTALLSTKQ